MKFTEVTRDLFSAPSDYALAHCISEDAKMGAGIAVQFDRRFPKMREHIRSRNPKTGSVIPYQDNGVGVIVLNLITKKKYWGKPTYETFSASLRSMKSVVVQKGITKVAMPQIGCGLDKLDWKRVREIIQDVFSDTDIDILVCKWNPVRRLIAR